MQHLLVWILFVVTIVNVCDTKRQQNANNIPYVVSRLFENNLNKPIILLLLNDNELPKYPKPQTRSHKDSSSDTSSSSSEEMSLRSSQNDERAYIVYHLLRTTLENEDLDPKTANDLDATKRYLRKALIARCGKLNRCKDRCAKTKTVKLTCTVKCEQVFDDLNACPKPEKPKNCNKPKCGKTMPPAWL